MGRPKKEQTSPEPSDDAQLAYSAYVHGEPINDIAFRMRLEPREVLEMIVAIEQDRNKK